MNNNVVESQTPNSIVERFWQQIDETRRGKRGGFTAEEWQEHQLLRSSRGLSLEETMQFAFQLAPTLAEFEKWVAEHSAQTPPDSYANSSKAESLEKVFADTDFINSVLAMPDVLSDEDSEF